MQLPLKRLAALTGTAAVPVQTPAGYAAAAPDGHGSTEALNVAHRGASAIAPENTIAAVSEGIAQRGDLIELDVQRSRDGLLLEIKAPELYSGIEADILREMRDVPGYLRSAVASERLVVQSFSLTSVRRFADLAPEIPVGLLGAVPRESFPVLSEWLDQVNPHHKYASASYVAAVHEAGMECLVWTVDSPSDMNRALGLGADGVITNKLDVLEQVLRERRAAAA